MARYLRQREAKLTVYHAIVEGDPLDNGGNSHVMGGASHSTIEGPDGRIRGQTHLGHQAWCAVCQSCGPIVAGAGIHESVRGWDERLQAFEAVSGDIVLCKCQRHPRVVAVYARCCEYIDTGGTPSFGASASSASVPRAAYDEQFTLHDANGSPLADTWYTARMPSGELRHGITDSRGRTERYETTGAQSIKIYIGHRQEA